MDDKRRGEFVAVTVPVMMELRSQYLAEGAKALKHWDQLQGYLRIAARTTDSPEQFVTSMSRQMRLARAPSSELSTSVKALVGVVGRDPAEWLEWLDHEYSYMIACMRLESERRREVSEVSRHKKEVAAAATMFDAAKGEHT